MNSKEEFLNLFNVIATPADVYRAIQMSPRWRMPMMFLITTSLILGWLMIPAALEPMRKIFASSYGEGVATGVIERVMKVIAVTQLVADPVLKVIRWVVLSIALYFLSKLILDAGSLKFKEIFSIVAYTEIIFILMSVITTLIIYYRGVQAIETPADLNFFRGLDYFLAGRGSPPPLLTLLGGINPFSLWYMVSIGYALHILSGAATLKCMLVTSIGWILWTSISLLEPELIQLFTSVPI